MMKQRTKRFSTYRVLVTLFAVSCFAPALGCAMDTMEEESLAGEPVDGEEETPGQEEETPGQDEGAADENGEVESADVCLAYGDQCESDADCCDGMSCHFDGYVSYCRNE